MGWPNSIAQHSTAEAAHTRRRLLAYRIPAIEHEIGAVDHRSGVAGEKIYRLGHLDRLDKTPGRYFRPRPLARLSAPPNLRKLSLHANSRLSFPTRDDRRTAVRAGARAGR
jgi:hypothetical protein